MSTVSDREAKILGIIETARAKRAKFRDERITMAHGAGGKATQGLIEGLLAPAYADFDAELRFDVPGIRVADPKACQCGEVLKGVIKPWECKVFGTACTPERPIGTCMVSSEGACAAYYNFGRFAREREVV